MNYLELQAYAKKYGIIIDENQSKQLIKNMTLVLSYNQKINLTAIIEEEDFIDKHLIDSLLCNMEFDSCRFNIIDIGTGGGFPGIPLAIKYPKHQFVLLDSTSKKIEVVTKISKELGLSNVTCIVGRAEELGKDRTFREKFDVVLSRGVAEYSKLLEIATPFLKTNGLFYSWKGPKYEEEIVTAKNALKELNMKVIETKSQLLLKSHEVHVIICSVKMNHTPEKYPRNFSTIKKRPL